MFATRESISNYMDSRISDLAGITDPDITFKPLETIESIEYANCLNLYFYDDNSYGRELGNPALMMLTAVMDLIIQVDPTKPLVASSAALKAMVLINRIMAVQSIDKMDYSVNPPVSMGTQISWPDSWPLNWTAAPNMSEKYIQKSCAMTFWYYLEKINV